MSSSEIPMRANGMRGVRSSLKAAPSSRAATGQGCQVSHRKSATGRILPMGGIFIVVAMTAVPASPA